MRASALCTPEDTRPKEQEFTRLPSVPFGRLSDGQPGKYTESSIVESRAPLRRLSGFSRTLQRSERRWSSPPRRSLAPMAPREPGTAPLPVRLWRDDPVTAPPLLAGPPIRARPPEPPRLLAGAPTAAGRVPDGV